MTPKSQKPDTPKEVPTEPPNETPPDSPQESPTETPQETPEQTVGILVRTRHQARLIVPELRARGIRFSGAGLEKPGETGVEQDLIVDGFLQEIDRAGFHRPYAHRHGAVAGHEDDR